MLREFRNGEELYLAKVPFADLQRGDVIAILNVPKPYVHRIIRISAEKAITQGDNNPLQDEKKLIPEDDFYRVTHAVSMKHRTRCVAGGKSGMVRFYQHQARRILRGAAGKALRLFRILPR